MLEHLEPPYRELYALLQVPPDASVEEIRKAYRNFAQVYHPDKYQDIQMKETATKNFQQICQAHEVLSDENKRQIYDLYGMEGLTSGLELGPKLHKVDELKAEFERLRRMKEQETQSALFQPSGTVLANFSLPEYLEGDGIMRGMAMSSQVMSQISKYDTLFIGGNLELNESSGGGSTNAVLKHQVSSASSIEFVASAGLRSLIGVQATRHLSLHSTASLSISKSFKDGSINLSNMWNRKLSDATHGNIQLLLGPKSSISVGWQKRDEKLSASGELKIGTTYFGLSAHCTHHFSPTSHSRIAGVLASNEAGIEVGGGRKLPDFGTVRMLYSIKIQGIYWKFELHHGGHKLIIPILLSTHFDPIFAVGAFFIPTSFYFLLKKLFVDPYIARRQKRLALKKKDKINHQVQEARVAAEKAQLLLQNVAERKRRRQAEQNGLFIIKALYGSKDAFVGRYDQADNVVGSASNIFDVTIPLNFLVNDSGHLKLHEGVKKSGIIGFCDLCPGEPKLLHVEYNYGGKRYQVTVDDYAELHIPQGEDG